MMIHEITKQAGKYKTRKRIGRGHGAGSGKTAGRGHKGARSRSGYTRRPAFEGGQMSFVRRMPKRGFSNAAFRNHYHIVNLKDIEKLMDEGAEVNAASLAAAGVIRDTARPLKVLGQGEVTKKFTVAAEKFSASARKKIEEAGGSVEIIPQTKWSRQGGAKGKTAGDAPAADAEPKKSEPSEDE